MDAAFIASRLLQYLAAGAGGTALFFVYGAAPRGPWRRGLGAVFALGSLAALGSLMIQASQFGLAGDAFIPARVSDVAQTGFGRAAAIRSAAFLLAAPLALAAAWRLAALAGAVGAAAFAFGGHAAAADAALPLAADLAHALAAMIWLGALPPLLALLSGPSGAARKGLERFSRIGPAVVAVLLISGAVNGWALLGPAGIGGALNTPYGRLLLAKLVLFAAMLAFAWANRRLTPRLPAAAPMVARTVLTETLLGLAVLAAVSVLGTLPPVV